VEKLDRIAQRPETMGAKACTRVLRVTVGMIVGQIGVQLTWSLRNNHCTDSVLSRLFYDSTHHPRRTKPNSRSVERRDDGLLIKRLAKLHRHGAIQNI